MRPILRVTALSLALAAVATAVDAQANASRERFEGSAIIRVGDAEHTIPIECDDARRPELGFSTESSRVTRERTGRTSMVNVRLRSSGEPSESVVSIDRYVAWIDQPSSSGGVLVLTLDLSPISVMRGNGPVALTREMWANGDRPEGLKGARIEAQCGTRDPAAPSYRKLPRG